MACHVWGDEKVGMDSEEFEKYVINSIVPL